MRPNDLGLLSMIMRLFRELYCGFLGYALQLASPQVQRSVMMSEREDDLRFMSTEAHARQETNLIPAPCDGIYHSRIVLVTIGATGDVMVMNNDTYQVQGHGSREPLVS